MGKDVAVPLTVLGGFLGAGKTTLLNRLLAESAGKRLAILVNDFGPLNIDAALIARHDGETISLTNGCVCCSMEGGLDNALMRVLGGPAPPDWIVIEASGVSDPGRIAQVGMSDPLLQLEGVVVMVDAETLLEQAADPLLADTIQRQIAAADILVVNKADLVTPAHLEQVHRELAERFGERPAMDAVHGVVADGMLPLLPGALLAERRGATTHDAGAAPAHEHEPEHPFASGLLNLDGLLDADALVAGLRQLPRSVVRIKGWVRTDRHGAALVQFAGRRIRFQRLESAPDGMANQLVYIGMRDTGLHDIVKQTIVQALCEPVRS